MGCRRPTRGTSSTTRRPCGGAMPERSSGRFSQEGVSGIGPVVLVADGDGRPLRPAILYGIDTRATREIDDLTTRFGESTLVRVCGNRLTTQAVGPKVLWIRRHEPAVWA